MTRFELLRWTCTVTGDTYDTRHKETETIMTKKLSVRELRRLVRESLTDAMSSKTMSASDIVMKIVSDTTNEFCSSLVPDVGRLEGSQVSSHARWKKSVENSLYEVLVTLHDDAVTRGLIDVDPNDPGGGYFEPLRWTCTSPSPVTVCGVTVTPGSRRLRRRRERSDDFDANKSNSEQNRLEPERTLLKRKGSRLAGDRGSP